MTSTLTVDLAEQINIAHAACLAAANEALEHAMRCGDLLIQAKTGIQHGRWQDWLANNFVGSVRSAQVYMRLANNRERLAKAQSPALLTIYEATQLLSDSSLNLPPDVEAKLAPLAAEIRGLLEEVADNEREERSQWQEMRDILGERIYDFAAAEMGMTESEVKQKLRGWPR